MPKLWARIGMSCEVTDKQYSKLKNLMENNNDEAAEYLQVLFINHGIVEGESYLPGGVEDNPCVNDIEF